MRNPVARVPYTPGRQPPPVDPDAAPAPVFFVTGGTLPRDAACYVARRADADLYDALARGQFCYVLTSRQMGKSSLMVRTGVRLQREHGATTASLDLTAVGRNVTVDQWYRGLLGRLGRQLDIEDALEDAWDGSEGLGPLQRWIRTVGDVLLAHFDGPIILFVDEIDAIRNLPFPADEFFAGIRECHNRRAVDPNFGRLTFCLLGVASPAELIADPSISPFNVGRRIEVSDFTAAEAAPLAQGLAGGATVLNRILHWTGGHPYLTQRLGAAAEEEGARTPADVDRLCDQLYLGRGARDRDDNLLFVQDRLFKTDGDVVGLLDLYGKVRAGRRIREEDAGAAAEALRLSGIIRVDDKGLLRDRNRIYHEAFDRAWVRANLPNAERQRQRAAYRRGVLRTLAGSAAALGIVGYLAARSMIAERAAFRERDLAQRYLSLVTTATFELAQRALNDGNIERVRGLLATFPPAARKRFEWRYLDTQSHAESATFGEDAVVLRFTPAGLLTAGADRGVRLWDVSGTAPSAPRRLVPPSAPSLAPPTAALSDDGALAAIDRPKEHVSLIDLRNGRDRAVFRVPSLMASAAFIPGGGALAVGDFDGGVHLFDTIAGRERWSAKRKPGGAVMAAAWSPDGRVIATGGNDAAITLWEARTGRLLRTVPAPGGTINAVAFGPKGRLLATVSGDGAVRLWDAETGRPHAPLENENRGPAKAIAFSPDGTLVATGGIDETVRLWSVTTGKILTRLRGHSGIIHALTFSADGRRLATAAEEGEVKVWEVQRFLNYLSPSHRTTPPVGTGALLRGALFSPDGRHGAGIADKGRRVLLWDTATGRVLFGRSAASAPEFSGVTFSPDGRTLAAPAIDGKLYLWATDDGHSLPPITAGTESLTCAAFAPDQDTVATCDRGGRLRLWNLTTRSRAAEIDAPHNAFPIVLSTAARRVAVGGPAGSVLVFSPAHPFGPPMVSTAKRPRALPASVSILAFTPDGSQLAVSQGTELSLFGTRSEGGRPANTGIPIRPGGNIFALAFSRDGATLATGGADGAVRLWDVATSRETLSLPVGRFADVADLHFSADENTLMAMDSQGRVRRWSTSVK